MKAKVTYRGWPGHFILGSRCIFHLNTLIEYGDTRVVVSTVGMMKDWHAPKPFSTSVFDTIGFNRYYETLAFLAYKNAEFWDADVSKQVDFDSEWSYSKLGDEWKANKGHWKVVEEIVGKLEDGEDLSTRSLWSEDYV